MLRTRVISAVVLLVIVAIPTVLGGLPFLLLVATAGVLGVWEFVGLFRQGGHQPSLALAVLFALLLIAQAQWPSILPLPLVLTLLVPGSLILALWSKSPKPASDWALTIAGALYLGWLLGFCIKLRSLDNGLLWLVVGAVAVWTADITAYFAGRAFGRHPWWPRHSPKKTWEGYLSGIVASTLVTGMLVQALLGVPLLYGMALGLLVATIAPLGDLAESMIKREVGAKDSSSLIPGHGGVLDRIDSLLVTAPLVFYVVTLALSLSS